MAGRALAGRWVRKSYLEGVGLLGHGCPASRAEGTLRGVCVEGEAGDEYVWLPWRCHLAASSLSHSLGALRQWASISASAARPRRILMAGRLLLAAPVSWPEAVCARVFVRVCSHVCVSVLVSLGAGVLRLPQGLCKACLQAEMPGMVRLECGYVGM